MKLELKEDDAKRLYPSAAPEFKEMLELNFGGKKFFQTDITERVNSFKDVCTELGKNYYDVMREMDALPPDEAGYKMVKMWVEALNEGWIANYNDRSEREYYPIFEQTPYGFRFRSVSNNGWSLGVGSRQVFKSEKLAKHAGNKGLSEYEKFYKK